MRVADPALVVTMTGPVRGRPHAAGTTFHGVPYAATPTGALRFAAPTPHAGWRDVLDGTEPGATAPQARRDAFGALDMSPYFGPGWVHGDDYLTATIWSPERALWPAPVMVFVHGGGFVAGSARAPLYDGGAFARDGVVLVVLNYRLGIPGFLHLPDAPDNRGLLDILAALQWVQQTIGSFGGDPGNVTLFGQSAGAILVGAVLADARSAGLVRRAIVQSGSGCGAFTTEQGALVATAVAGRLGVEATAAALGGIPDARLIAVAGEVGAVDVTTATARHPLGGITSFGVVRDTQPAEAVAGGAAAGIDLLIGSNSDEGALYLAPVGRLSTTTESDVRATAAMFHARPDDLLSAYRAHLPGASLPQLRTAVLSDGLFGVGTARLTEAHAAAATARTFAYEFTWHSPALDGHLGASHVMELPFVFDVTALPALSGPQGLLGPSAPPAALATRMHSAWVRFATIGDPGWAPFDTRVRAVQQIGSDWRLSTRPRARTLDAWARHSG